MGVKDGGVRCGPSNHPPLNPLSHPEPPKDSGSAKEPYSELSNVIDQAASHGLRPANPQAVRHPGSRVRLPVFPGHKDRAEPVRCRVKALGGPPYDLAGGFHNAPPNVPQEPTPEACVEGFGRS